jgi:hypothetical protein
MNAVNRIELLKGQAGLTIGSQLFTGLVTTQENGRYTIDKCIVAEPADGLGIALMKGDYVAYLETPEGNFITSLLKASKRVSVSIEFACADTVNINADHLILTGRETVSIRAAKELTLETCQTLKISCENLFQTAIGSVVNVMKNWVQHCDRGSLQASQILQIDAENQIITATKDLRLDAERINMG